MKGMFVKLESDQYTPEQGGINWKRRLNARLEEQDVEIYPVGYYEGNKGVMQVTQDNTVFYLNQTADELDCVAVKYDQDPDDLWTWYFRDKFETNEDFARVAEVVGVWACMMTTLYPMAHVVQQYERFNTTDIADSLPEGWEL